jgi:hypothetical protein
MMTDTAAPLPDAPPGRPVAWRSFIRAALAAAATLILAAFVLLIWADPFGLRQRAGTAAKPLLDSNQRFMFPQLVRARQAEAVILGTSSVKLIKPELIEAGTGLVTHNLAMNAATPWEQVQLADLIRREGRAPKLLIWGLDTTWCEADATSPAKLRTPRPFPDWLYARASLFDLPQSFSFTAIEIATRRLGQSLMGAPPRIRADGYDEFTPPDAGYDVGRARFHLYRAGPATPQSLGAAAPPLAIPTQADLNRFPALVWLDQALQARKPETIAVLMLPPIHSASLGDAEMDHACKAAIASIAQGHRVALADYRFRSPLTTRDENFWDPLHYRVGIAADLARDLVAIASGGMPATGDTSLKIHLRPGSVLPRR